MIEWVDAVLDSVLVSKCSFNATRHKMPEFSQQSTVFCPEAVRLDTKDLQDNVGTASPFRGDGISERGPNLESTMDSTVRWQRIYYL